MSAQKPRIGPQAVVTGAIQRIDVEITLDGYGTDLKRPRAAFGSYRIQEVTEKQIELVVRAMRDEKLARRSSAKMLTTLRAVFDLALRRGVIRFNPAKDVTPMGRPSRQRDALTVGELEKLRAAIEGDPWEACWMLTLAGLRRSELLGLRWTDFNPTTGELAVTRGRVARGGLGDPKTARGRRVLPLDKERIGLLVSLNEWQAQTTSSPPGTATTKWSCAGPTRTSTPSRCALRAPP